MRLKILPRGEPVILALMALLPLHAAASEVGLDTVVVTATRTEKPLSSAPVRVQVVGRADIERKQATNLADALRDLGGLRLVPIHGKPGESVRIQGMESDHVLILVDGRPVSASTGSTVDARQVTTFGVERIEVIKGPASALYGSSAMGGVINVITGKSSGEASQGLTAQIGSWDDKNLDGEPGSYALSLNAARGGDNWIGQLLLARDHSEGFDLSPDTYANSGAAGDQDNINLSGNLFVGDNWDLSVDARLYREDLQYRISSVSPGAPDGIIKKHKNGLVERDSLTFGADGYLGDGDFSGFVHLEDYEEVTEQDAIATPWIDQSRTGRQETLRADLQWDRAIGAQQLLTVGLQLGRATLAQFQVLDNGTTATRVDDIEGEVEQSNQDAYLQHDWTLAGGELELVSGLRLQHDSDFGTHLAPKISFRKTLTTDWTLRGSLGQGYRVPNLKERHYVFDHSANGYMVIGNPDLQPETNNSLQLSAHWAKARHNVSVGLFYNDLKDLIDTALDRRTDAGIAIYNYQNVDEARIYGADIELQTQLSPTQSISVNLMRLSTLNRETDLKLGDRPELQAGALWKAKAREDVEVSLGWRYESGGVSKNGDQRELRHASIVDASAHWQFNPDTRISLNLDNLGDSHLVRQDNSDLRPREGRELRLTLDHQF